MGKELLYREMEEVARTAMEAQRPCLQICLRHFDKTIREAMAAGYLFNPHLTSSAEGGALDKSVSKEEEGPLIKGTEMISTPTAAAIAAVTAVTSTGANAPSEALASGGTTAASVNRFKKSCQLPCPRYCGAVFCGMGRLVCLNARISVGDPAEREKEEGGAKASSITSTTVPRTYADLLRKSR